MDADTKRILHRALFEISLNGIRTAGDAFPLGGFILVGAMIDMLAGLRYPSNANDRTQRARFERFVNEYFPERYRELNLAPTLWQSLRCTTLHNFSSTELILADSQPGLHLTTMGGARVLHWPETLDDYATALVGYWTAMSEDPVLEENAARRCAKYPPLTIRYYGGAAFPLTFPLRFSAASGYGA